MGAIQAYHSLSDQLDSFRLLLEGHFGELIEPERLYLLVYMAVFNGSLVGSHFGSPEIQKHVYMYLDLRRIQNGSPRDPH